MNNTPIMNFRGEKISWIGNLDRCQSRFHPSYPVHRGITFNILPVFDFFSRVSTRKWKVSGRPSFQLSLVTSSNHEHLSNWNDRDSMNWNYMNLLHCATFSRGHGWSLESVRSIGTCL